MLFKMTTDDWDTVLGIHLRGSFLMSKACQKYMVDQKFGRIVNLSSITNELDSRTMAVKSLPGLYFIGEVVDVTGWLGGFNFQWAWSSGWCAGQSA